MAVAPGSYRTFLADLKQRIRGARLAAALSVNKELVLLYWSIGRDILARQRRHGWGAKVIDRLAADLHRAFPDMTGMSARNLRYMRTFARVWPQEEFVQQVAAQLPWGHNMHLLDAVRTPFEREWYARQAIENGWSRNVLAHQIASGLFARRGRALTNFSRTLPAEQSELAQQIVKDPYSFAFLSLAQDAQERDLERGLTEHLRALILELGKGFAFVGSQLRYSSDQPSIGIILCKRRNAVIVEYALRDTSKPMGVVEYSLSTALPQPLQRDLPTAEELAPRIDSWLEGRPTRCSTPSLP